MRASVIVIEGWRL